MKRCNPSLIHEKHEMILILFQDSPPLSIELTQCSRSHLFRHASEITKETKGGYLQVKNKQSKYLKSLKTQTICFLLTFFLISMKNSSWTGHCFSPCHWMALVEKKASIILSGKICHNCPFHFVSSAHLLTKLHHKKKSQILGSHWLISNFQLVSLFRASSVFQPAVQGVSISA